MAELGIASINVHFPRNMLNSLLQGTGLKSKEFELAMFLFFQGMPVPVDIPRKLMNMELDIPETSLPMVSSPPLTTGTIEFDVRTGVKKIEQESNKRDKKFQIKGESENVENEDAVEKQDPTYSPNTPSQAPAARYPCETCGKNFRNQTTVKAHSKKHLKQEESKDQTFVCTICLKVLSSKYILANHTKSHNEESKTIDRALCNVCTKSFSNKYILKKHIETHSEETTEALSCDRCYKSFRDKYSLKYHIKAHDGNTRDALCNICSKTMIARTLKKHMKNIHGEKKIVECSYCGMNARMSSIKEHERRCKQSAEEREARKFKCGECGKALSTRDKLRDTCKTSIMVNIVHKSSDK